MSTVSVTINTPHLNEIVAQLAEGKRPELYREIGTEVRETVREHLFDYALTHHRTAFALGARPTGNLEEATFEATADSNGATVTVGAKGIRRALGDLTIIARNKKALTIPLHALSYGRRVAELTGLGIAVFRPKGKNYLATVIDDKLTPIYALVKQATLKHEPDLLPSNDTITANAVEAARHYINNGGAK